MSIKVLVTGASGQLARCIKELTAKYTKAPHTFVFKTSAELDISNTRAVADEFNKNTYTHCINCAAYTQVDLAEKETEKARLVNVLGPKNLAMASRVQGAVLIHISTDFVFDGMASSPYTENSPCRPLGVYGVTKLEGEQVVQDQNPRHFILRTSWLYSEYGHNFMKTMLRLGSERNQLSVVSDQIGTPTYAKDLADLILQIVLSNSKAYGIYHFSNRGMTSWFGFAEEIFRLAKTDIDLQAILTEAYPTPAKRPKYSVLDKMRVRETFGIQIPDWKESLQEALKAYQRMQN